jgi:multiple sugar transport system substrate-binding protein
MLPLEGMTQKVVVVDDPAIAEAIRRLKAEWKAVSGAELQIAEVSAQELLAAEKLDADLLIYPSALLGSFVQRQWLSPFSAKSLESGDLAWADVFELLRSHEMIFGKDVYALPLGSPVFTLVYRADVFERLDLQPPKTWQEYQSVVSALHNAPADGEVKISAVVEPLAPGWAGKLFLARAAPYAKHQENYSALFRIDTLEPLIAGPPFVKAMEELASVFRFMPAEAITTDPAAAMKELLAGRTAMAITWASAADRESSSALPEGAQIAFAPLPGSATVFQVSNEKWETRNAADVQSVPLLAISGRLASVSQASMLPEGVFRLAAWLAGPRWSLQVASASKATTLYRDSQLKAPQKWTEANLDASASLNYAETVQRTLAQSNAVSVPRIPGEAEYMQALDEAVAAVLEGKQTATDALNTAAERWEEVSQRYGKEKQRSAYHRSLGLNP